MTTPLISLANDKRAGYKKLVDLGFAINIAAGAGGVVGFIYGAILLLQTSDNSGGGTNHPTLALGVLVVVLTAVTGLVLLAAGRVVLATARVGLRALREQTIGG